jgi:hypothetical protein
MVHGSMDNLPVENRRIRRSSNAKQLQPDSLPAEEMLLVRSIHISDRFGADKKRDRKLSDDSSASYDDGHYSAKRGRHGDFNDEDDSSSLPNSSNDLHRTVEKPAGSCINLSTVLGAGAVVMGLQIAMLVVGAMLFLRRRDTSKKLMSQPRPTPQQTIFVKRY